MGRGPGGKVSHAQVHSQLGGLDPSLVKLARELRHDSTAAEVKLWQCLRDRRLNGFKFRRQHPLGANYIPDFYCAEVKVSVELYGSVHDSRRAIWSDGIRHRQIQEAGVRILRFKNGRVRTELESVLREIASVCESRRPHPPTPSPSDGEGENKTVVQEPLCLTPQPPPHVMGRGSGKEADTAAFIPSSVPPLHRMERGPGGEVWCEARHLRPGSLVIADHTGRIVRLAPIERVLTEEAVYDLVIEEDHSFVTETGIAHNCGGEAGLLFGSPRDSFSPPSVWIPGSSPRRS